jgi:hypothetical protein
MSSGKVVHICNPSTWEAEAGGSVIKFKPRLGHIEKPLSKKQKAGLGTWFK